jgi:hypothetical protein
MMTTTETLTFHVFNMNDVFVGEATVPGSMATKESWRGARDTAIKVVADRNGYTTQGYSAKVQIEAQ